MNQEQHLEKVTEAQQAATDQQVETIRNRLPHGTSATECIDCGDPIPEPRRTALPGVQRCTFCQHYKESKEYGH